MNLEEKNSREIEDFLKSKGAEVVGFASLEGIRNVPKEYPNSILIGIPIEKEALKTIYTDDQSTYVEAMKSLALKLNDIVLDVKGLLRILRVWQAKSLIRQPVQDLDLAG